MARVGQAIQQPFKTESRQHILEILVSLTRAIQQALTNRGDNVAAWPSCHVRDSIYGRMTLDIRQTLAASHRSSIVAFFSRQQSRSASMATSSPILLRNLKQSATVLAGV